MMDFRNVSAFCKAVVVLSAFPVLRLFKRRSLWLISDRDDSGGDNGEVLFLYLRRHHPSLDVRFVVDGNSPTACRLRQYGPVVPWRSLRRKCLTLLADCLISSQAQRAFYDPLGDFGWLCRPIVKDVPFVFLQHGVIKDDMSAELGRQRRPISGFVTSARRERESIVNCGYGYGPQQVWLTGLPRFDVLRNSPKKKILLMPTWRRALMADDGRNLKTGEFVQSAYFSFYNRLINDETILNECRLRGYRIVLALHPNFRAGGRLFRLNDDVELAGDDMPYADLFSSGDILVTDYSSTAFDFAYLRKPVIYAQFDAETFFFGGHSYSRGYYDYEKDGFGEIARTVEEVVATLVDYLKTGCRLKPEYRRRIDEFFAFDDRNNCARVVASIQQMLGWTRQEHG